MQCFIDRLCGMVLSLDPNAHLRHVLHKRENARFIFVLFADDCVDLTMTEFCAKIYDLRAFFDTITKIFFFLRTSFAFVLR